MNVRPILQVVLVACFASLSACASGNNDEDDDSIAMEGFLSFDDFERRVDELLEDLGTVSSAPSSSSSTLSPSPIIDRRLDFDSPLPASLKLSLSLASPKVNKILPDEGLIPQFHSTPPAKYFLAPEIKRTTPQCGLYTFPAPAAYLERPAPCLPTRRSSRTFSISGIAGELSAAGSLSFSIYATEAGFGVSGADLFKAMLEGLNSNNILRINAFWHKNSEYRDNFDSYHYYLRQGLTPVEAAVNTFTGRMALRSGYRQVRILPSASPNKIEVEFSWPGFSLYDPVRK